jgi:putative membrane protein insertion efficiency factor
MNPLQARVPTADAARRQPSPFARVLMLMVRLYQMGLSPVLGWNCRFEPTCSRYMVQALARHGAVKGLALGLWRLVRCHPFSKGGYDPVP